MSTAVEPTARTYEVKTYGCQMNVCAERTLRVTTLLR